MHLRIGSTKTKCEQYEMNPVDMEKSRKKIFIGSGRDGMVDNLW